MPRALGSTRDSQVHESVKRLRRSHKPSAVRVESTNSIAYPPAHLMSTTYLFGYGSLINVRSRGLTSATALASPARLAGLRRGWFAPVTADRITYLAVQRTAGVSCNGVIVKVDAMNLPSFDAREKSHNRISVNRSSVELVDGGVLAPGVIWAYECLTVKAPTPANPIVQSYVDVVLDGCLAIGDAFAREFIRSTAGWRAPWVNDRQHPRYPRHVPTAASPDRIDALLEEAGILAYRDN